MPKKKCNATVVSQSVIGEGIFSMWLSFDGEEPVAAQAVSGQFLSLYSADGSRLLPRPISICEIDAQKERLRIVYRVVGAGTAEFSGLRQGDTVAVIGPLGNGFTEQEGSAILIGGGIGIPPLLELAKRLSGPVHAVLGYRGSSLFLKEEFEQYADVYVSTEDGSVGTRGNVIDAIRENGLSADWIYACGPMPMLRGVSQYAEKCGIPAQISLEERMACGVGACLGCVCQTKERDGHSNVNNRRVCKDGPVFYAGEIQL